ncbi:MAG: hypothetical protein ACK46X_18330, partial [Candidatus Sericytochromatia bacterium]
KAASLGLTNPGGIKSSDFQLRTEANKPLKGAKVMVGGQLLETNEQGNVTLPEAFLKANEGQVATVEAPGYWPVAQAIMPGFALKLVPVSEPRKAVGAASGGIILNAAGDMKMTFAPGSLSADSEVAVRRAVDDNETVMKDAFLPPDMGDQQYTLGRYSYQFDLGGAQLQPGANVTVSFKVQGKLLRHLQEAEFNNAVDKVAMSKEVQKDADGTFWFTMKVPVPGAVDPTAAANKFGILAAQCQTFNDPETYYVQVFDHTASRNVYVQSCRPVQSCDQRAGGGVAVHDPAINGGHCYYTQSCPDVCTTEFSHQEYWNVYRTEPRTRHWKSASINAQVRYRSDDPRFENRVAAGVPVYFAHAGTIVRSATNAAVTGGDGYASAIGAQGAWGYASARDGDPNIFSDTPTYSVDCGTVNVSLSKYRPVVTLSPTINGTTGNGNYSLATSVGNLSVPGPRGSFPVTIDGPTKFAIKGSQQVDATNWVDAVSSEATLVWNGRPTLPVTWWFNKSVTANAVYESNDSSVPADQRPTSRWAGQAASGASLTFAHNQSNAASKPAGRDQLSFSNVGSATAWGLAGVNGSVKGDRTVNGISFTGSSNYNVNGSATTVKLGANLPQVRLRISGAYQAGYVVTYKLDGQEKQMALAAPVGGLYILNLPVEDPLNNATKHTFQLESIDKGVDFSVVTESAGNTAFPTVPDLHRGKIASYDTPLRFESIGVK